MTANVEQMMRDSIAAYNAQDIEKFLTYCTDDIVYEAMSGARLIRGKEEMRPYLGEVFSAFPDFKIDLKLAFACDGWAAMEWIMSGTFKGVLQPLGLQPTGKRFSVRGASITKLRDNKVWRNTDYYDSADLFRQIGVMA